MKDALVAFACLAGVGLFGVGVIGLLLSLALPWWGNCLIAGFVVTAVAANVDY